MSDEVVIVIANYKASNKESYLAYLDKLSEERKDGGLLHGGHIHYIQQKISDMEPDMGSFILKQAIKGVLDRVPEVFPLDLPERIERDPDFKPTPEMNSAFRKINEGLILPLSGYELIQIIKCAREYALGVIKN